MKKGEVIKMLNKDLKDEHAAVIRYLVHGWLEGEDTPFGASLLSRSREEMWHMHWLGFIIGQLGGEPDLTPAPYPFDPTNRATIFKSYVEYEEKLIPHYYAEAEKVDDTHIKRVLQREAWESAIHAKKFQRILNKLSPEDANGLPGGKPELPAELLNKLQMEVTSKYNEMLQHIRYSWVFHKEGILSWQLMEQAMEKMKQIAHFAEDISENGIPPIFKTGKIDIATSKLIALKKAEDNVKTAYKRHLKLKEDSEFKKHTGLVINLELTIQQEEYQAAEIEDMRKSRKITKR
ncbi:MAG: ferritin-like domain-containing protein [Nitrospirota bacterium]